MRLLPSLQCSANHGDVGVAAQRRADQHGRHDNVTVGGAVHRCIHVLKSRGLVEWSKVAIGVESGEGVSTISLVERGLERGCAVNQICLGVGPRSASARQGRIKAMSKTRAPDNAFCISVKTLTIVAV